MKAHFQEYCSNTSIHGLKYVGEGKRPLIERLCWAVSFVFSVLMCCHLIKNQWEKWQSSPVIVSFAATATPIWQIPFPAVTICSETKFRQTLYNFSQQLEFYRQKELDDEERKELESASIVCVNDLDIKGNMIVSTEDLSLLEEVAQPLDEMIHAFSFKDKKVETPEMKFIEIMTDEGRCYTFNMLNKNEIFTAQVKNYNGVNYNSNKTSTWHVERGYAETSEVLASYPRRALGSGIKAGFKITLETRNIDVEFNCRGLVPGFKFVIHNPGEAPRIGEQYFRAPLNQEMTVAITPTMITTSEGLRSYSAQRRQCYFSSEHPMRYFKEYTQNNCVLECLTNYTLKKCSCVSLSMPRSEGVDLCGPGSRECMSKAAATMLKSEVENSWMDAHKPSVDDSGYESCDCLPACNDLQYSAETSQAAYEDPTDYNKEYGLEDSKPISSSTVNIFFKDTQIITSQRSELFGRTDFVACCGGLLGLFMGFSVLSLVEIIYHCSVHSVYKFIKWLWSKLKRKEINEKEHIPNLEYITTEK